MFDLALRQRYSCESVVGSRVASLSPPCKENFETCVTVTVPFEWADAFLGKLETS